MSRFVLPFSILLCLCLLSACQGPRVGRSAPSSGYRVAQTQVGIASIYRDRRTASGERFNAGAYTAAHRHWPMGTRVRVTHLGTGRATIVRINDRGPYIRGRVIDLTPAASSAIGLTKSQGVARVRLERLF